MHRKYVRQKSGRVRSELEHLVLTLSDAVNRSKSVRTDFVGTKVISGKFDVFSCTGGMSGKKVVRTRTPRFDPFFFQKTPEVRLELTTYRLTAGRAIQELRKTRQGDTAMQKQKQATGRI